MEGTHGSDGVSFGELFRQLRGTFARYWHWLPGIAGAAILAAAPIPAAQDTLGHHIIGYGILCLGAAATLVPSQISANRERKRAAGRQTDLAEEARKALEEAKASQVVTFEATLRPILIELATYLNGSVVSMRKPNDLTRHTLDHCRAMVSSTGVTASANFYRYEKNARWEKLVRADHTDTIGRPSFEKGKGDPEADAAVSRISAGESTLCADVSDPDEQKRLKLDPVRARSYKAFATVPVALGDQIVGMLSVNTQASGHVDEYLIGFLKVMANVIAMAEDLAGKVE